MHATQATTPNGAAIINTSLMLSTKACLRAIAPAAIIVGVMPGILVRAAGKLPAKASTKTTTDVVGSPALIAAAATYSGTIAVDLLVTTALKMAIKMVPATLLMLWVSAVAVAIR